MAETDNITKVCSVCKVEKELLNFTKQKSGKYGVNKICKECKSLREKQRINDYKELNKSKDLTNVVKKCGFCKLTKNSKEFYPCDSTATGLSGWCIACKNIKDREYHAKKPKKIKPEKEKPIGKVCSKCKEYKLFELYRKVKDKPNEVGTYCKTCSLIVEAEYRKLNLQKIRDTSKKHARKPKARENSKIWKRNNATRVHNERMKDDDLYRITFRCRAMIRKAIQRKGFTKRSKTQEILGCNFEEFKLHIESLFVDGMSWEKRSEWHIDHIIPLATAKTYDDVIRLNNYTNLQPLWAEDNLRKSDKLDFVI